MNRRFLRTVELILVVALAAGAACRADDTTNMTELQRLKSGGLDVVLLSRDEALRHGKDTFTIEFRSTPDGKLVDVGNVRVSANMPMPGMAMFGNIEVQRTNVPGRYTATSDFGMAGTWRMKVEWDGPAGRGAVDFTRSVQ
jgi:hypothetical protein